MADKKSQRVATALSFANLGLEQNAQAERAHAAKVAQALQLMGLTQQQDQNAMQNAHAVQLLGLQQSGQANDIRHQGVTEQQAQSTADMQNWQATDTSQRAWDTLQQGQKEADMKNWALTDASARGWEGDRMQGENQKRLLDNQDQQNKLGILQAIVHANSSGLPVNPAMNEYLGKFDPQYGAAQAHTAQKALQDQIGKLSGTYNLADPKGRTAMELGLGPDIVSGLRAGLPQQVVQPQTQRPNSQPMLQALGIATDPTTGFGPSKTSPHPWPADYQGPPNPQAPMAPLGMQGSVLHRILSWYLNPSGPYDPYTPVQ